MIKLAETLPNRLDAMSIAQKYPESVPELESFELWAMKVPCPVQSSAAETPMTTEPNMMVGIHR